MKIIVIGSQGFLGRVLCQKLQQDGKDYLGVDSKPASNHAETQCDITKPQELTRLPIAPDDLVINLSAKQWADTPPKKTRQAFFNEVNVKGLKNILEAMRQKNCHRLISFSSDMVYGLPQTLPLNESHPQNPIGEYGKSKQKAEALCQQYRDLGFNITVFRPRLILGPGRLGVLAKLFRLIESNKPVPLIGKGENYYQMISVFDCVSAIEKAITANIPNQAFNLGSSDLISTFDLLNELITAKKSKSKLIRTNAKFCFSALKLLSAFGIEPLYKEQYSLADKMYYVDCSQARRVLNWQPQYNDRNMLLEAYDWYINNKK